MGEIQYNAVFRCLVKLQEECKDQDVPGRIRNGIEQTLQLSKLANEYTTKNTSPDSLELDYITMETQRIHWEQLWRDKSVQFNVNADMLTGRNQGQLLKSIAWMSRAQTVLDVGTFTGYSALAFAEAVPGDGTVDTCELDPYVAQTAERFCSRSTVGSKIRFHVGPAIDTFRKLAEAKQTFDLIFIDADKGGYKGYYQTIMEKGLLADNGTILFDNAFMRGYSYAGDILTTSLDTNSKYADEGRDVNDCMAYLSSDPRIHRVLVPSRDGLMIVRRKTEGGPEASSRQN